MNFLIPVIILFVGSFTNAEEVWTYQKFGSTKHDVSPCILETDQASIAKFIVVMRMEGNALYKSCDRLKSTALAELKCQSRYSNNFTHYYVFSSQRDCKAANKDWTELGKKISKHMNKVEKQNKQSTIRDREYLWMKSSFDAKCFNAGAGALAWRSVCKGSYNDEIKISLNCSEVPGMTMKSVDLYSTKKICEEAKK